MALTVADLSRYIDQVIASDLSSELTYTDIVNQAGQHLVSMHPWKWLERPSVTLSTRAQIAFTSATWSTSALTLSDTEFAVYTDFLAGDMVDITAGANATLKSYVINSAQPAAGPPATITLAEDIGADDSDADIGGTIVLNAVALPSDFMEIIYPEATQSLTNSITLTTLHHLHQLRTQQITITPRNYWGAIAYGKPAAGGDLVPRLEIWPTPTTDGPDELSLFYRAGWTSVADDEDTITLPVWSEPLFIQLVRAFASGYEEYDEVSMQNRLDHIQQGPEFRATANRDGAVQGYYGPIRGGAVQVLGQTVNRFLRTTVSGPS